MKLVFVTLAATLAATLAGTTAFAGGFTPPVANPEPVVAPAPVAPVAPIDSSDWTGGYVGLQYGQADLDLDYPAEFDANGVETEAAGTDSADADAFGVYGGYMHDFGTVVAGGELDYNKLDGDDDSGQLDLWRLRGRVGYDLGRWLPYANLGIASLSGDDDFSSDDFSETGITYGIGVDFKVTEQFVVGAEYNRQHFSEIEGVHGLDADLDLIQIRGAYRF